MVGGGWGRYRAACDEARAERLRQKRPAYHIVGEDGSWNAVHLASRTPFGPLPLRRLAAEIEDDAWRRAKRTLNGALMSIRAVTR